MKVTVSPPWITRDEALKLIVETMRCSDEEAIKLLDQFVTEKPESSITIEFK